MSIFADPLTPSLLMTPKEVLAFIYRHTITMTAQDWQEVKSMQIVLANGERLTNKSELMAWAGVTVDNI